VPAYAAPAFPGTPRSRWVHVEFLGVPGAAYRTVLVRGENPPRESPEAPPLSGSIEAVVTEFGGRLVVEAAPLTVEFDSEQGPLPVAIRFEGRPVLDGAGAIDVRAEGDSGVSYRLAGRRPETVRIERSGPTLVRILAEGSLDPDGAIAPRNRGAAPRFRLRTTVFAASSEIRFDLWILPTAPLLAPSIRGGRGASGSRIVFEVGPRHDPKWRVALPGLPRPRPLDPARPFVLEAVGSRTGLLRWGDRVVGRPTDPQGAVTLLGDELKIDLRLEQFQERFPKSIEIVGDGKLRLVLHDGFEGWVPGSGRRHRIALRVRGGGDLRRNWAAPAPVPAFVERAWARRFAAPEPLSGRGLPGESAYAELARAMLESHARERKERDAFGEWDFGDWPMGRDGWGNLEYDTAFGHLVEFYRSGEAAAFAAGIDGLRHWVDVDRFAACRRPEWIGLPRVHGSRHGAVPELGHVWVDGVLHGYYLTGDPFLREAFEETAGAVLRCVRSEPLAPLVRERNAGWALHVLACAAEATGETRFCEGAADLARAIASVIDPVHGIPWFESEPPEDEDGEAEGGASTALQRISPPVLAGVLIPALTRAYRITPDSAVRDAAVGLARFLLDTAIESDRPGIRGSLVVRRSDREVIERGRVRVGDWALFASRGFACAGRLAGDERLLDVGRRLFEDAVDRLVRTRPRLDGRARSRILLNGPAALGLLGP